MTTSAMDTPTIAAQIWAQAHAARSHDPVLFGQEVAKVHRAAQLTLHHAGDAKATAAALAALSIAEVFLLSAGYSNLPPSLQRPDDEAPESLAEESPTNPRSPPGSAGALPASSVVQTLLNARLALVSHSNCLITDRSDLPRAPDTGWTTDFTQEIKAIDDAIAGLVGELRNCRECGRCSTRLSMVPSLSPATDAGVHLDSRTPYGERL